MDRSRDTRLGEHLERCGLLNEDTPGFEATENAMALTHAPRREESEEIQVERVETFGDFALAERVATEVFGMSE